MPLIHTNNLFVPTPLAIDKHFQCIAVTLVVHLINLNTNNTYKERVKMHHRHNNVG